VSLEKFYFALTGCGMAIAGLLMLYRRIAFLTTGTRTEARWVDWEKRGRRPSYHPVIEFTTTDGSTQRITGLSGYSKKPANSTQTYQVIYEERAPSKGLIYSFLHFWGGPIAFLSFPIPLFWLFFSRLKKWPRGPLFPRGQNWSDPHGLPRS